MRRAFVLELVRGAEGFCKTEGSCAEVHGSSSVVVRGCFCAEKYTQSRNHARRRSDRVAALCGLLTPLYAAASENEFRIRVIISLVVLPQFFDEVLVHFEHLS